MGELGAYEKGDMASRLRWTNFIARQAEARNRSYWQFGSDFIVYDISKGKWVKPNFECADSFIQVVLCIWPREWR